MARMRRGRETGDEAGCADRKKGDSEDERKGTGTHWKISLLNLFTQTRTWF
jgi:hypothetical protein